MRDSSLCAVVLAGGRAGGSALARAHGLDSSVLIDVAGQSSISRVLHTLDRSVRIKGGCVVGPNAAVCAANPALSSLFAATDFRWLAPGAGPSASALDAARELARYPLLITAADHALLTEESVDDFIVAAELTEADVVVGLVAHEGVKAAFPASRRTVLRFSDGAYCGSNLFYIARTQGESALRFWQALEADRKRPWRMAAKIGIGFMVRYLAGRLSINSALTKLSARIGARLEMVTIDRARAAVDVDSEPDLILARGVLEHEHA